jgi:DNA-binding transcriptional ArsR family regulator
MKARRDVYQAIADPTRRAIIQYIAAEPLDIKSLTEKFNMTQQAISLHVKLLTDCGLITMEQRGRNRYCRPQLQQLGEVEHWIAQYRQHWENKLDNLELYLKKLKKQRNDNAKK